MKTVLLIATLDTKGREAAYIKERIEEKDTAVLVLDCGTAGLPIGPPADLTREAVAREAGRSYADVLAMSRDDAGAIMADGTARTVRRLYDESLIDGVLGIGGSDGTILATAGMRPLPLGFPKLVVSAMACGNTRFGEYVGTKDVTVMPSGVDVAGVTPFTRRIFDNAVAAICGMVSNVHSQDLGDNLIAVTMYGQTTECVTHAEKQVADAGYELVAFHPNGFGGALMEEMIEENTFQAVWDLTPQELSEEIAVGLPEGVRPRLISDPPGGLPRVVSLGCLDFIWRKLDDPAPLEGRLQYRFNPQITLGKLRPDEMEKVAALMVERVNALPGQTTVLLPLGGISQWDKDGEPFREADLDEILFTSLREGLRPPVRLLELDAHINDAAFSAACATALIDMLADAATGSADA